MQAHSCYQMRLNQGAFIPGCGKFNSCIDCKSTWRACLKILPNTRIQNNLYSRNPLADLREHAKHVRMLFIFLHSRDWVIRVVPTLYIYIYIQLSQAQHPGVSLNLRGHLRSTGKLVTPGKLPWCNYGARNAELLSSSTWYLIKDNRRTNTFHWFPLCRFFSLIAN